MSSEQSVSFVEEEKFKEYIDLRLGKLVQITTVLADKSKKSISRIEALERNCENAENHKKENARLLKQIEDLTQKFSKLEKQCASSNDINIEEHVTFSSNKGTFNLTNKTEPVSVFNGQFQTYVAEKNSQQNLANQTTEISNFETFTYAKIDNPLNYVQESYNSMFVVGAVLLYGIYNYGFPGMDAFTSMHAHGIF